MDILFIGCVKSSEEFLLAILENTEANVIGIITKVESPFNADHVSLHKIAEKNNIEWIDYENNKQLEEFVVYKKPDLIYCFGWSYLLPTKICNLAKVAAIGYHPAKLPQNRGRHPIIWTLVLGLKETASTFFYLADKADSGDIVSQEIVGVSESENATSLYEKLLVVGKKQVVEMTNNFTLNTINAIKQDEQVATYWRKRSKQDGKIDWRMHSLTIDCLIRALTFPYVGAHFEYKEKDIIVWESEIIKFDRPNIEPGKILEVKDNTFIVKTGDTAIKILKYTGDFLPKEGDYL